MPGAPDSQSAVGAGSPFSAFAFLVIALGGLAVGLLSTASGPAGAATPAPSALAAEATPCRGTDRPAARGRELITMARSHMARYPFAPEEGPRATALAAEASSCLAGHDREAAAIRELQARWLSRISRDYSGARGRLGRALETSDADAAVRELELLTRLLQHRDDEYVRWLGRLKRDLTSRKEER